MRDFFIYTMQAQTHIAEQRVGIQGIPGAFHHLAAESYFGADAVEVVPFRQFQHLAVAVARQEQVSLGLMAIENSLAGSLLMNYHLLMLHGLQIHGEVYLRIRHNLLALAGQRIDELVEVHSHPMAIEQCRPFFLHHPMIRLVEADDTAASARRIRERNMYGIGAIASERAGELYDLEVLSHGIESNPQNYTRFLVVGPPGPYTGLSGGDTKMSICLELDHRVGTLSNTLQRMAEMNLNLLKIQSVPIHGEPWRYRFFLDFMPPAEHSPGEILHNLKREVEDCHLLGAYPSGKHI